MSSHTRLTYFFSDRPYFKKFELLVTCINISLVEVVISKTRHYKNMFILKNFSLQMVQIYHNILVILFIVYMLFISFIRFSMIHVYISGHVSSVALKTFSVNMYFPPRVFPILLPFCLNFHSCLLQMPKCHISMSPPPSLGIWPTCLQKNFTFSILCIMICYKANQQMHTIHQNYNVLICQLPYVQSLTDPSSRSAQLYKTIIQIFIISSMQYNCQSTTCSITLKLLLHVGDDKKVIQLFYATTHSLVMGQCGPKHVEVSY